MLNSNVYSLIITVLTFVIAIVLTMRQVERTAFMSSSTIRPVADRQTG